MFTEIEHNILKYCSSKCHPIRAIKLFLYKNFKLNADIRKLHSEMVVDINAVKDFMTFMSNMGLLTYKTNLSRITIIETNNKEYVGNILSIEMNSGISFHYHIIAGNRMIFTILSNNGKLYKSMEKITNDIYEVMVSKEEIINTFMNIITEEFAV